MTFYNNCGMALFYTDDNEHLFDYNGSPLGYIYENSVYNYNGNHIGWFDNGWINAPNGQYLFFNENANGGPMKPMKFIKPMKSIKYMKPMKSMREMRPMKPMRSLSWSSLDLQRFFRY